MNLKLNFNWKKEIVTEKELTQFVQDFWSVLHVELNQVNGGEQLFYGAFMYGLMLEYIQERTNKLTKNHKAYIVNNLKKLYGCSQNDAIAYFSYFQKDGEDEFYWMKPAIMLSAKNTYQQLKEGNVEVAKETLKLLFEKDLPDVIVKRFEGNGENMEEEKIVQFFKDFLHQINPNMKDLREFEKVIIIAYTIGLVNQYYWKQHAYPKDYAVFDKMIADVFGYSEEMACFIMIEILKAEENPLKNEIYLKGRASLEVLKDGKIELIKEEIQQFINDYSLAIERSVQQIDREKIKNVRISNVSPDGKWFSWLYDNGKVARMLLGPIGAEDGEETVLGVTDCMGLYDQIYPTIELHNDIHILWSDDSSKVFLVIDKIIIGLFDLESKRKLSSEIKNNILIPIPEEFVDNGIPKDKGSELKLELSGEPLEINEPKGTIVEMQGILVEPLKN